jgi:hypothetical protein
MAAEAIGAVPGGGQPYGDIYNTNMPDTQAAQEQVTGIEGKMLLMQQRQQAAQKQAKLKEAAEQQDKIDAQVRGADIPAVHSAYNDWRAASMDLQQNSKNLPRDEYLDRQNKVNQKYAAVSKLIAQSAQGKILDNEDLKNQADQSKSLLWNDNAHNILNQRINTPITEWGSAPVSDNNGKPVMDENNKPKTQDLGDPSLMRYTPKEDFSPLIEGAVGKSEKLNGGIPVDNQNGINRTTKDYTGSHSAYNIASTISDGLQSDDKKSGLKAVDRQMDLIHQYGNVSDADMAATDKQYNQQYLTNPDVRSAYGLKGNEAFPNTGNPKIDGIVKYIAEKQAMLPDNMPKAETKTTTNEAAKTAEDHQWDKDFYNYKKNADKADAGKSIDDSWANMNKGNGVTLTTQVSSPENNGMVGTEKRAVISAPTPFKKMFAVQIGTTDKKSELLPDDVVLRPNGNYVGMYYQRNDDGTIKIENGQKVARTDITPVELDKNTAKLGYAKAFGGEKAVAALSKYQQQGKTYSFKGKSVSQAAVTKAAAASGMSVDDYIKQAGLQ